MAVTIKDIAKVCNVSYSTVSRVLNSKFVKSTERNDKILATARALGYKPNQSAIQLVKNTTNMIGLLIPDVANPHYSEITKHVEDAALTSGYQVFLCNTDWDVNKEARYRDALMERRLCRHYCHACVRRKSCYFSRARYSCCSVGQPYGRKGTALCRYG